MNTNTNNRLELRTLKELRKTTKPIRNVYTTYQENLTVLERIARWITEHVGSMGFFLIIFIWTIGWLFWNTLAAEELRFDPFPAFVLWLFISNMIQLLLFPLILIGQNLQARHDETRADVDFDVNLKSEKEIETVLIYLEHQHEMIMEIKNKLEDLKNINSPENSK
ncbi:MAG: DUF1003 domain-containing protein [Candidatus Moranbacteria bacterium]|nr:DUF1003 domain-containing protein [Candidatus Moranbacteria bacterium]